MTSKDDSTSKSDLAQSEERFKILVDSISDYAIFILDPDGRIQSWNTGAERFKGYKAHEVIGKHFSIFYTKFDIDRDHPKNELKIAFEKGVFEEEGWRVRKDGTQFWASVVITKLLDSKGLHIGYAKVTRDLTERKLAEEKLRKANEELDQRVKDRTAELEEVIRSRDEFISIVSHELRTPVTSLKLQVQTALRQFAKDSPLAFHEKSGTFFKRADKQLDRISVLLNDILDISRISMDRLHIDEQKVNINEIIQEVVERFDEQANSIGARIDFFKAPPTFVRGDSMRLEQVFSNLISNAFKYGDSKPIKISIKSEEDKVKISVSDKGIGVASEDRERIFERFERATNRNIIGGIGVGLFISKKIVEAHHGEILLESELSKGSVFTVVLSEAT